MYLSLLFIANQLASRLICREYYHENGRADVENHKSI